jgi:transcriptional regulator with XRE-family HTH domain
MSVAPRTRFGEKLRKELDARQMSVRALARVIDPNRPEAARRNLVRWIGGYNDPSRISRIAVADALGLPHELFLEEDDEEADPLVALMSVLRRVVQQELAKERV